MRTTIDSYKARAGRLDLDGIEFGDFRDQPLAPDALRSLRYMHDIEHHTVCYLRDLLLTPAHQDPADHLLPVVLGLRGDVARRSDRRGARGAR